MIDRLLSPEVQQYIRDHQRDDPFLLSLKTKTRADFPLKEAIEQIQSLQKAAKKLPSWIAQKDIIWPPPVSVEQASSELTANFKSKLVQGKSLVDLTGGMGADTISFAEQIEQVIYVESDEHLCALAEHNFKLFVRNTIEVRHQTSEEFLQEHRRQVDAIYIDPSRRSAGKKVFRISNCAPDLYEIIPECKKVARQILLKLSPIVDLTLLINDFQPSDIWVVAVKNEVKEVLLLLSNKKCSTTIHAIDLDQEGAYSEFSFDQQMESNAASEFSLPLNYLYEPNAAILKTGAFKLVGQRYGLNKLHRHSHLYTSHHKVSDFPGRIFNVKGFIEHPKKDLSRHFPTGKVNVISRNHPLSATQLKKKYSLSDGGDSYLIGTTRFNGKAVLIRGERL